MSRLRRSALGATAYHEAGHAVIGRVLDLACGSVTIVPDTDDGSAGYATTNDVWDTVGRWMNNGRAYGEAAALRGRIITYMAGAEAEVECLGQSNGGDDDDRLQIALMLEALLPPTADVDAYDLRLRSITRGLVRRHQASIRLIASALLERGTLADGDVMQIMGRAASGRR